MGSRLADSEGEKSLECIYCRSTLGRKKVSYTATREGSHLIIDDVSAWVCEQCGEPLFDEGRVDTIQEVLRGVDAGLKRLADHAI